MPQKKNQPAAEKTNDHNDITGEKGGHSVADQTIDIYSDEEIAFIPDMDDVIDDEEATNKEEIEDDEEKI